MRVVYRSMVRVERVKGPLRKAWLPAEKEPVMFSVHGAIADYYNVPPGTAEEHATTLDYIVACAADCLVGTFGGALEARKIDASGGRLVAEATGEVEHDGHTLMIKRILVTMKLTAAATHRETIERVFGFFAGNCPIYRMLKPTVEFQLNLELGEPPVNGQ